jgi:serine/threonine protein kinase
VIRTTVGHYRVLEKLGEGGMGVVYRACQLSLNRIVAVKMIQPGRVGSAEMVLRFQAEAKPPPKANKSTSDMTAARSKSARRRKRARHNRRRLQPGESKVWSSSFEEPGFAIFPLRELLENAVKILKSFYVSERIL